MCHPPSPLELQEHDSVVVMPADLLEVPRLMSLTHPPRGDVCMMHGPMAILWCCFGLQASRHDSRFIRLLWPVGKTSGDQLCPYPLCQPKLMQLCREALYPHDVHERPL